MFKNFMRMLSLILIVSLLWNMLPVSVLGAALRAAQDEADTPVVLEPSIIEETEQPEEISIIGELTDRRTENIKEYLLSNGNTLAAVYGNPVHYQEDGQWKDIDNTLTTKADGTYVNTAGAWDVSFPQTLSNANHITITKDGYTLSFGMAGQLRQGNAVIRAGENVLYATEAGNVPTLTVSAASISQAQIQQVDLTEAKAAAKHPQLVQEKLASRLAYSQVYANTDIVYDLDTNRVKESVILSQYDSTLRGYRYTLNTGGMIPVLSDDGHIDFYDARGEEIVMTMPAPFLVDANFEYNWDVEVTLTGSGNTYTLTYTLPQQWLAAEDRAWPVVLDPVVNVNNSGSVVADQTVFNITSKDPTWGMIQCGYSTTTGISRFYLAFKSLPTLTSADVIVDAQVTLHKAVDSSNTIFVGVHSVNSTWTSSGITWANKPSFGANVSDFTIVQESGEYTWDVTDIARGWYETGVNTGMMFKSTDAIETQSTSSRYAQFYSSDYGINKPALTLEYRNTSGLEDYWDYTSASAGRAGTAYVNNSAGNLVFVRNLMAFGGNRMPVSIDLVYNASDKGSNSYSVGNGWRTNYNQRIYPFGNDYYVWEDADGTQHYFRYDATKGAYYDEDNLNLVITEDYTVDTIIMTDLAGNTSTFEMAGRLIKIQNNQETPSSINITYVGDTNRISQITDGVGRKYVFTYTNNLLTRISYHAAGTSELHYVNLSYTNGTLTGITDADAESCTYTYENNLLKTASDPHNVGLSFTYQNGAPNRIAEVAEHQITVQNNIKTYSYGNTIGFSYDNMWTEVTDTYGNKQYMLFNTYGNTVSVQNDKGQAAFAEYATDQNTNGRAHQLIRSSDLQHTTINLISDGGFEGATSWYGVANGTATLISSGTYIGTRALNVTASSTADALVRFKTFTVGAGESYTLSAYIKAGAGKAYLRFADGSTVHSQSIDTADTNWGQWRRFEVTYTNTSLNAKGIFAEAIITQGGSIAFDCIQLEKSSNANRYNLIENSDFSVAKTNTANYWWSETNLTSNEGRVTTSSTTPITDNNAMLLTGSVTTQKRVHQTINVSGTQDDVLTLAGWGKGYVSPNTNGRYGQRRFGMELIFYSSGGTISGQTTLLFNPHTDDWQYIAGQVKASSAYSYVIVTLFYDYGVGDVYFDGIQLYKESFGSTYKYSSDGDLIESINSQGQLTRYTYENRNLSQIQNPDGSTVAYQYDTYKNVYKETITYPSNDTPIQHITEYTYDSFGNLKSVTSTDKGTATATYTDDGNYLQTYTDENLDTTTYNYNQSTGVLEYILDPSGKKVEYTYDEMYRSKGTVQGYGSSVQFTYNGDELQEIKTNYIANPPTNSTAYSFDYGAFGVTEKVKAGNYTLVSYEYDAKQNLTDLIYNNAKVNYVYDSDGRVTEERYLQSGQIIATVKYSYDDVGRLVSVNDGFTNRITNYSYDANSRLLHTETKQGSTPIQSARYQYDEYGHLVRKSTATGTGAPVDQFYIYNNQQLPGQTTVGNVRQIASYKPSGMLTKLETGIPDTASGIATTIKSDAYAYRLDSSMMQQSIAIRGVGAYFHSYAYDSKGNITQITISPASGSSEAVKYTYDDANQLIREDNQLAGYSWVMTYDTAGNMLSRKKYSYSTGTLGSVLSTQTFTYGDNGWGDVLTKINNTNVTSDELGNILSDGTNTYTWKNGRQLATSTKYGATWSYNYDASGLRTQRNCSTTVYNYTYDGTVLTKMTYGNHTLFFTYGINGHPMSVNYNGTDYYYLTNALGDVLAILNSNGTEVVSYTYDAWGNILSITGSHKDNLGVHNPLRYRGYVYDQETGLYYLQSRYYNPAICRFISADSISYLGADGTLVSYNLFAYCNNNPVMYSDPTGHMPNWLKFTIGAVAFVGAIALTVATGGGAAAVALGVAKIVSSVAVSTLISAGVGYLENGTQGAIDGAYNGFMFGSLWACGGAALKYIKVLNALSGTPNSMGQAGEKMAGIVKNTKQYRVNGRWRIPDGITRKYIQEVKNVKVLSFTTQIKDSLQLAKDMNRTLQLFVRPNTYMTAPLRKAIITYGIKVTYLW